MDYHQQRRSATEVAGGRSSVSHSHSRPSGHNLSASDTRADESIRNDKDETDSAYITLARETCLIDQICLSSPYIYGCIFGQDKSVRASVVRLPKSADLQ